MGNGRLPEEILERYFTAPEVMRMLRCTRIVLQRMVRNGEIPRVRRGPRVLFPKAETTRAVTAILAREGHKRSDEGERDAEVLTMLRGGATAADVIAAFKLPLPYVEKLEKAARGPELAKAPTAEDEERALERERERWEKDRKQRRDDWLKRRGKRSA